MRSNLKTYQKVNRDSSLTTADPHRVIVMLFDGLLEGISIAKGAIERKDLALKSTSLSKSINILRSFQDTLDFESEPEISDNFNALYEYCIERLTEASISLDISELDHVVELLKPIIDAWKEISESDKQVGYAKQTERDLAKTQQSIGL
jgi:flagellar protein FliS